MTLGDLARWEAIEAARRRRRRPPGDASAIAGVFAAPPSRDPGRFEALVAAAAGQVIADYRAAATVTAALYAAAAELFATEE